MGRLIFLTGGVRSGKSSAAVRTAAELDRPTLFVATAMATDGDMSARIARHRAERPAQWRTVEAVEGTLAEHVAGPEETLVLDCLTLYVSRRMGEGAREAEVTREVEKALGLMRDGFETAIVVSNEVGSGVIPANALARTFSEALGRANQAAAATADEVLLMVSGLPLKVK